ncbi:DUF4231 domain-containing protein [Streptomyces siamensis]
MGHHDGVAGTVRGGHRGECLRGAAHVSASLTTCCIAADWSKADLTVEARAPPGELGTEGYVHDGVGIAALAIRQSPVRWHTPAVISDDPRGVAGFRGTCWRGGGVKKWLPWSAGHSVASGNWDDSIDENFPRQAAIVRRYLCQYRDECRALANVNRILYRYSGILSICLGVTLPFLSASEFEGSSTLLAVASLLLATLTGLGRFYNWEQRWRIYRTTDYSLTLLIAEWELRMLDVIVSGVPSPEAEIEAEKATRLTYVSARSLGEAEITAFFSTLNWSESDNSNAGAGKNGNQ